MSSNSNNFSQICQDCADALYDSWRAFCDFIQETFSGKRPVAPVSHTADVSTNTIDSRYQNMLTEVKSQRAEISKLQDELENLKGIIDDLRKRLNSITGEVLHDQQEFEKKVQEMLIRNGNPSHPDIPTSSSKAYYEPSNDGMMLINMMPSPSLSCNFIELDTVSGEFTILQSAKCVEYILANRDYALGCCNVKVATASPQSIHIESNGWAEKTEHSNDWRVTKKINLTLI